MSSPLFVPSHAGAIRVLRQLEELLDSPDVPWRPFALRLTSRAAGRMFGNSLFEDEGAVVEIAGWELELCKRFGPDDNVRLDCGSLMFDYYIAPRSFTDTEAELYALLRDGYEPLGASAARDAVRAAMREPEAAQ